MDILPELNKLYKCVILVNGIYNGFMSCFMSVVSGCCTAMGQRKQENLESRLLTDKEP